MGVCTIFSLCSHWAGSYWKKYCCKYIFYADSSCCWKYKYLLSVLTAIQICCLTSSVGRKAFVLPLSSFELDPNISIFLEPPILEVELCELTWEFTNICSLCGLGRVRIGKLQDCSFVVRSFEVWGFHVIFGDSGLFCLLYCTAGFLFLTFWRKASPFSLSILCDP